MRRGMLVVMSVAVLTAAAGADWPPRLIASFPAPPGAIDVAYENRGLYVLIDAAPPTVCELTTSGSLLGSFGVPVPAPARGITYDGRSWNWFFISNRINGYIYKLTTAGSLASSFRCPAGAPYGLGFTETYNPHGRGLFAACRDAGCIARLNATTGSLLSTFAGPAAAVVTYDDFFAGVRGSNVVYWDYLYGPWRVFSTMPARPLGIAAGVDWPIYDQWVQMYILCQNGYVYRYEGYTAVAPASLGRVKALYR
jgi:hypothetical protein